MSTYADVVADVLQNAGIEFIFGVPGSLSSVELIEAARKRDIRYILCSNESSAAVKAGTYGILTGRPGVVSTGVGPGAAAVLHGVANNYLERAPCLILTDRFSDEQFRRQGRQRLDQDRLLRPITKGTFKLAKDNAAVAIRRALALATEGRPGPVHVDLPYDVILANAGANDFPPKENPKKYIGRIGSAHPGIGATLAAISESKNPIVIAGLQVNRSGREAEQEFVSFAEKLGAPVLAAPSAKGVLPEHHPLAMGTFRGAPSERELIDKSDLFILVGFDTVEVFAPGYWDYPQKVINLDEVPHLDDLIRPEIEVVAHLADILRELSASVSSNHAWNTEEMDSYKKMRQSALFPTGEGLMPGAVVRVARECLPDNGIMTADAGSHKVLANDIWETRRPLGYLTSSGLGSMAVATPAAMAAKLTEPDTPVVCLTGDGGFLMRIGDMEVAVRENIPFVTVVFNDRYLNLIKIKQDNRSFPRLGTEFRDSDYASVARGLGCEGERVSTEEELKDALKRAFSSDKPWVIDAVINPDGYVGSKDVRAE